MHAPAAWPASSAAPSACPSPAAWPRHRSCSASRTGETCRPAGCVASAVGRIRQGRSAAWRAGRREDITNAGIFRLHDRVTTGTIVKLFRGSPKSHNGLWRSLVAHLTGGQGVAGSNPVNPTSLHRTGGESLRSVPLHGPASSGCRPVFGLRPGNGMLTRGNRNRGEKHESFVQVYPLISGTQGERGASAPWAFIDRRFSS